MGAGHFEGLLDITDRFLTSFYGAFDVRFLAEEFITSGKHVVVIGRIHGQTRNGSRRVDVPFVHVWTVHENRLQRLRAFTDTAMLARALTGG